MTAKTAILSGLKSPDPSVRSRTISELDLGQADHDALQLLSKLAREDSDATTRVAALFALSSLWPDPTVVRLFRSLLQTGDMDVAGPISSCLGRIHDAEAEKLLFDSYLKSESFAIRWLAFETLIRNWSYRDVAGYVLGYFLSDSDDVIRATAVAYLGNKEDPAVLPELIRLFDDPDARVRSNAIEAARPFWPMIKPHILSRLLDDPNHRVRSCAALALFKQGRAPVEPWMKTVLASSVENVRASAAWVLRQLPDLPGRASYLKTLLEDPSRTVQRQAILTQKMLA